MKNIQLKIVEQIKKVMIMKQNEREFQVVNQYEQEITNIKRRILKQEIKMILSSCSLPNMNIKWKETEKRSEKLKKLDSLKRYDSEKKRVKENENSLLKLSSGEKLKTFVPAKSDDGEKK
jgi:hypothetical protein